ncbi:TRAP transporter small permease [Arenimonas sp.]|uniref:TRAP transporter small permease n=1 Tax=Arenimonas sp. TaxID=1872635 RepID=UPI0039E49B65
MSSPNSTDTMPAGSMDRLANVALGIAALALLGLVLVQGWQVFARYVLNDSPSWTEPATLLLLSTCLSLAAASGVHRQRHFSFHLLADAMGPTAKRAMQFATQLAIAGVGGLLAYDGAVLALANMDVRAAGAPWPQGTTLWPLSLGGLLMLAFSLHRLSQLLRRPAAEAN